MKTSFEPRRCSYLPQLLSCLALLFSTLLPVWAQNPLRGKVTDPSGAPLSGVTALYAMS